MEKRTRHGFFLCDLCQLGSALRLLAGGAVNPVPLIVARYSLSKGLAAFEHAAQPGALKVLLEPAPS